MAPWFCTRSLTRSMGAAAVFDIAAAVPPIMKLTGGRVSEGCKYD